MCFAKHSITVNTFAFLVSLSRLVDCSRKMRNLRRINHREEYENAKLMGIQMMNRMGSLFNIKNLSVSFSCFVFGEAKLLK